MGPITAEDPTAEQVGVTTAEGVGVTTAEQVGVTTAEHPTADHFGQIEA